VGYADALKCPNLALTAQLALHAAEIRRLRLREDDDDDDAIGRELPIAKSADNCMMRERLFV